ncbi:MAG TPA: peptide ligase PGM1-related protein, partial [Acidimicrobiales bacterium]|nr:peptide ligase PGM1-related protein [Acidimicrobiales bacterium]
MTDSTLAPTRPGGAHGNLIVAVPSISYPVVELRKIAAVQSYEERMLFVVLLLADPEVRIVFVTSEVVDPAVVDYYLRFLPDPEDARRRLRLVAVGDPTIGSLSEKLLARPADLERLRTAVADLSDRGSADGGMLPFNVTGAEQSLADALGLPLYGPRPDLVWLGSKSGSRQMAMEAGVPVLPGVEDVFSVAELAKAVASLRDSRPEASAVVVKLNNGFSGQGNAILELDGLADPLTASATVFCAPEESWPAYEAKIEAEGVIVEEVVRSDGLRSPSVQLQISPCGEVEVLSTHDQILGGPQNQVYLGCRFPARSEYRGAIQAEAEKVARVLASRGVTGVFGIDFLVLEDHVDGERVDGERVDGYRVDGHRVTLSEINLRVGGTTHPYWMARLTTGGTYDRTRGELIAGGVAKSYMATDNLKIARLAGSSPAGVIAAVDHAGLAFDPSTGTGVTLHLLGGVPGHGKLGATCVANSPEAADDTYR